MKDAFQLLKIGEDLVIGKHLGVYLIVYVEAEWTDFPVVVLLIDVLLLIGAACIRGIVVVLVVHGRAIG